MATPPLGAVVQYLRTITRPRPDAAHSDGQLLTRFLQKRDEAAFAALVERHGPLVLGVCRRILAQRHDTEDAFQATFLVLVRKAASLDRQGSLASWLYTVAYRLACKIRVQAARRQAREKQVAAMRPAEILDDFVVRDVLPILDEELHALPEKYRSPLVLCYLQGKTNLEAARELGWRPGSMSRRLTRGRDLLRQRLVQRGVVLSAAGLAALQGREVMAALPATLGRETVRAAMLASSGALAVGGISANVASLVEATVKEMFVLKLKAVATMLLVIIGAGTGAVGAVWSAIPDAPPHPVASQAAAAEPPPPLGAPAADGEEKVKTDLQGDPLPTGALRRFGTVRLRHGGPVASVAFSPDGKTAASGGGFSDNVIRLWDTASARELRTFKGHTPIHNSITGLAFTPDGKHILSCALDSTVRLWDVATGVEVRQFRGHQAGVTGLALAADGKQLATASRDATVRLWDVATGAQQHSLAHTAIVNGVAFSPDGKMLAAALDDGSVHLYDPATGKELKRLMAHAGGAYCVAFAPDSKSLASGGNVKEKTVRLWDVATAKELQTFEATNGPVQALAFAPDGKSLAVGIEAKQVLVLDPDTGKPLRPFQGCYGIRSLVFSPDGKTLMTGSVNFSVTLLDVATGKDRFPFAAHHYYVGNLSFSPDGRTLRTCAQDQEVHVWDAAEGKEMRRFSSGPQHGKSTAYSPDGKLVAAANYLGVIQVFDLASGKQVRQFGKNEGPPINALAWSADGKALAAGGYGGSVLRVWDAVGGELLHDLGRQDGSIWSLAFSPDGKYLASGREDRTVCVWDLASGKERHRLTGPPGPIEAVAFSPDSRWLAAAPRGDTIWVWDPESGQQVAQLPGHTTWISAVEFSADGRTLASGGHDNTVRLWETATWKERARFEGHRGAVVSLAFAPDGRTLASGSADSSALVWDLRGGRRPSTKPSPPELKTLWSDIASDDAAKAYRALCKLVESPEQALPLVRNSLRPVPAVAEDRLKKLIADLDDDAFAVREKATDELAKVGGAADPLLRRTLEGKPSAEQRRRIQHLLARVRSVGTTTDGLRQVRALELLEYVGTEEAKALLKELAKGAPTAALTEQAKAALKRCERRCIISRTDAPARAAQR